jgi:hypothetical protein
MAESPRRWDLRLTITAAAPYTALAGELAGKFAEYAGADPASAGKLRADVEALTGKFSGPPDIELTMEAGDQRITVTATAGSRRPSSVFCLLSSDF